MIFRLCGTNRLVTNINQASLRTWAMGSKVNYMIIMRIISSEIRCISINKMLFNIYLGSGNICEANRISMKSIFYHCLNKHAKIVKFEQHLNWRNCVFNDDVIKWKHFPPCWPIERGIHRPQVNTPHKGQWRGALVFCLICVWTTVG